MSEVDNLLDATLDDLEDLPTFEPFSAGAHRCSATMELKEINGNKAVELSLKGLETIELSDPTSGKAIKEGDTSSVLFMLNNEFGLGNLKKVATPISVALGTVSIRDTIDACKDVEVVIISSLRKDKNDPDKFFMNIKELNVV